MNLIAAVIDAVFPRRCPVCHDIVPMGDGLICYSCKDGFKKVSDPYCLKCGKPIRDSSMAYCSQCTNNIRYYDEGRAAFIYEDIMRKSIYSFKYGGREEYAKYYASQIYAEFGPKIKEWNAEGLIPIPIHKSRYKKRGYNQAYLISKELSKLTGIPTYDNILKRVKNTVVQKNLNAIERSNNLKNAFKITKNAVKLQSAILVDDIYTTGSTINVAAAVLKDAGTSKIYYLTLSIGQG